MTRHHRVSVFRIVTFALLVGAAASAEPVDVTVVAPNGDLVSWQEWVGENAPTVVVLWASWAPGAADARGGFDEIAEVAEGRGMSFVVVSVQETINEAKKGLAGVGQPWFHDRYGGLLKRYRVVSIPMAVVISRNGEVAARMEPVAAALRMWENE
jgi:hypothetical protein